MAPHNQLTIPGIDVEVTVEPDLVKTRMKGTKDLSGIKLLKGDRKYRVEGYVFVDDLKFNRRSGTWVVTQRLEFEELNILDDKGEVIGQMSVDEPGE